MTEHDLSAADHERLAEASREHQTVATGLGEWCCSCSPTEWRYIGHRSSHIADALAPVVADMRAAVRQEARDEAVAPVLALIDTWPTGDNGQEYRLAVTQCAAAVRAALGDSGALARIRAEALEDSRAVRRLREAAERRGAERERERIAQAIEADDPAGYFADDVAEGYRIGQEFAARIARGADDPAEAESPDDRPCYRCGRNPAEGFASIWTAKDGERWYCHGDDDESPTCYEGANVADDPAEAARGGE